MYPTVQHKVPIPFRFLRLACLSSGAAIPCVPAIAAAKPATVASITDGDTFRTTTGERVRIAAIDTPETRKGQAKCEAEIKRGRASSAQLRALIDGRTVDLTRTGRSYNRTVAIVRLDGRDVAAEMIRRGAAKPWPRRRPKPDWCSWAMLRELSDHEPDPDDRPWIRRTAAVVVGLAALAMLAQLAMYAAAHL